MCSFSEGYCPLGSVEYDTVLRGTRTGADGSAVIRVLLDLVDYADFATEDRGFGHPRWGTRISAVRSKEF